MPLPSTCETEQQHFSSEICKENLPPGITTRARQTPALPFCCLGVKFRTAQTYQLQSPSEVTASAEEKKTSSADFSAVQEINVLLHFKQSDSEMRSQPNLLGKAQW